MPGIGCGVADRMQTAFTLDPILNMNLFNSVDPVNISRLSCV